MFAKPHLLKGFRIKSARVEYFKKGVIYNLVYINFVTIFSLIFIFLGTGDTITQQFGTLTLTILKPLYFFTFKMHIFKRPMLIYKNIIRPDAYHI